MATKQFVFLPDSGDISVHDPIESLSASPAMAMLAAAPRGRGARRAMLATAAGAEPVSPESVGKVVARVEETGACLVDVDEAYESALSTAKGGAFHPVVYYEPAVALARIGRKSMATSAGPLGAKPIEVRVVDSTGAAVANATVGIRSAQTGAIHSALTDKRGVAMLPVRGASVRIETLMVEPGFSGHWGLLAGPRTLATGATVTVEKIDLAKFPDGARRQFRTGAASDGRGVTVGVVDSGVGPHRDLPNATGDADSTIGHGTHVAGIIGGRGTAAAGIAPGVAIRSYRVFDDEASETAANFAIHEAILSAVRDGCDLVNLSLKIESMPYEPVVANAIRVAGDRGVLVFAAAGNDFGKPVSFPARNAEVVAVASLGDENGLPPDAYDRWTLSRHRSPLRPNLFFSAFSNEGPEVDVVATGSGVVSTVPGDAYAPMSGTSMACPSAVGMMARYLSSAPQVMAMPRNRARRDAMLALFNGKLGKVGLGANREGKGMPT